jgi:hypothetical protein
MQSQEKYSRANFVGFVIDLPSRSLETTQEQVTKAVGIICLGGCSIKLRKSIKDYGGRDRFGGVDVEERVDLY